MGMSKYLPVGLGAVLAVQQVLPQTGRALHRDWTCKRWLLRKVTQASTTEDNMQYYVGTCGLSCVMNANFTIRH